MTDALTCNKCRKEPPDLVLVGEYTDKTWPFDWCPWCVEQEWSDFCSDHTLSRPPLMNIANIGRINR